MSAGTVTDPAGPVSLRRNRRRMTYAARVAAGWSSLDQAPRHRGVHPYAVCDVCGRDVAIVRGELTFHAPAPGLGRTECAGTGTPAHTALGGHA